MGWKDWSYWLKGGTIFGTIHILAFFFVVYPIHLSIKDDPYSWPAFMIMAIPDFPIFVALDTPILGPRVDHNSSLGVILLIILGTLQWFVIGAVFGWIYGKIKNREAD